jgi:mono/diheme cytochrome c family protein
MNRMTIACLAAVLALGVTSTARAADPPVERTWKAKCASCHGEDGKGQTKKGKEMLITDFSSPAWQKSVTDEKLKEKIENGTKAEKDGHKQEMDAYKDKLKPEQIDGLVKIIRSLGK